MFSKHYIHNRTSGGVAILAADHVPSMPINLNTNLQAVAIQIQMHSLITVCSLYLPPNERVIQSELNNLISQLPSPFIILGDFNGHSPFWGSPDSNPRGLQIEQLLTDHNLCLLNSDEKTHFHLPTRTFHSVDLAVCSPSLLPFFNLTVDNDLYNSDHFPLIASDNRCNPNNHSHPSKYILNAANWQKFTILANIQPDIIQSSTIDDALDYIVDVIIEAANNSIPKSSGKRKKQNKPWWDDECKQAYKAQRKAWGIFRRYPTASNFIYFKKTRAVSRRIQRRKRRLSWQKFVSSISSKISSHELWKKSCLASARDSSPGPDNINYSMIKNLTVESQKALLLLYNRIWNEQYFPTLWQQAIVIPILKPGKDPKNPENYRPIALTCCMCKLLEKMINRRLVYHLETNHFLHPHQSGFRKSRCTLDNLLALETDIRLAFLQGKHLVAIFFDIEKAYDRTWRFGILKDLHDHGLRGNLPIFIQNFLKLRKFRVKVESEYSDYFIQEEGVPQGSILSVTLFILKINNILKQLPPSVKGYLYVDDLYISCTGMHMNFIERQLQTAVNNITQWCNANIFTISASKTTGITFDKKLTFLPHVKILRKKCEKALNIIKVLSTTAWGADRPSMLKIYKALVLSKLDYGCVIYGSARKTVLQKLDPVHHNALRLCSGAFRTSPVQSLYVDCFETSLEFRREILSLHYYFRTESNTQHPFHNFKLRPFLTRIQEARKFFIPVYFTRIHNILKDLNLLHLQATPQLDNIFPPWAIPNIQYLNPFEGFTKSDTSDSIYRKIFNEHRHHYNDYIAIYTDGSKTCDSVSFAVVFQNAVFSFKINASCSVFTAEISAVLFALEKISDSLQDKYIIYTDSLSVLQSLKSSHYHSKNPPLVLKILNLFNRLSSRGFTILLSWVPSHVGIGGNEKADSAAKSATSTANISIPVSDLKKHISLLYLSKWQTQWDLLTENKLHSVKPRVEHWPCLPNRKADTILTRLRIGHTRFTHRHLLFGEAAPMCSQCNCTMSVYHILSECPNFSTQRLYHFNNSTFSHLLDRIPHANLFAFLKSVGFYPHI
ncbi:uncharacterized protein LOC129975443 [Argiope bruennichi]|uniref:uncharacterized protein LOC129975443 n=1 Tax=Argiope bruennichi TaxID=94029 RepID=UPI002493F63F|nr:uncharacterized protein LOC129975443 [Argiope bruennichi]